MRPSPEAIRSALERLPDDELLRRWHSQEFTEEAGPLLRAEIDRRGLVVLSTQEMAARQALLTRAAASPPPKAEREPRFFGMSEVAAGLWKAVSSRYIAWIAAGLWVAQVSLVDAGHVWAEGLSGYVLVWLGALVLFGWFTLAAVASPPLIELGFAVFGQPIDPSRFPLRILWFLLSVLATMAVMGLIYLFTRCSSGDPEGYDRAPRRPL